MVGGSGVSSPTSQQLRPSIGDIQAALRYAEVLDWIIGSKDLRDLLQQDIERYLRAAASAEVGEDLDRARANARKIEQDAAGRLADAQAAAKEVLDKANVRLTEAKAEAAAAKSDAAHKAKASQVLLSEASQSREEARTEAKRLEGLSRDLTVLKTSLEGQERDLATRKSHLEAVLASLRG